GQLSLDSTLAYYLPELQGRIEYADRITLRMLVQHTSGIPNYTDTKNYWVVPKETADENLALILDLPANFLPVLGYAYCNTNYLLLDRIMSRVLGHGTFQYIQEAILSPLGLQHTYGSIYDVDIQDVMSGYYVGYEQDLKTDNIGSMLATAEDLGKFVRALNGGSVFKDAKEQEIYASIYKFEHTGLIPGYQTIARYDRALDAVVIQFTNTVDFGGYNWSLSEVMYGRILKIIRKRDA
ncbi:MAG: beta-lactamase family protein, partial [Phaeodactylibacter sp.]|nr:beta-lactamase family protein [Phaeodactylibacter sp.]